MKPYFLITILFLSISVFAQQPNRRAGKSEFTPEQQAELKTKKLALSLDLNEKQITKVQALELEIAQERVANRELRRSQRVAGERPSEEELFDLKSKRLDRQTAHQNKMKSILTKDQYANWKDMYSNNAQNKKLNKRRNEKGPQKGNRPAKGKRYSKWN